MSIATDMRRPERSLKEQAKGGERSPKALVFVVLLWLAMFIAMTVLLVLIVTTLIDGASRLDSRLFTEYPSSTSGSGRRAAGDPWLHLGDRHHRGAGDTPRRRSSSPARGVRRQDKAFQPHDRSQRPEPRGHPLGGLRSVGAGRVDAVGGAEQKPGHRRGYCAQACSSCR